MAENTAEICKLVSETELLRIMECPICQNVPFPPIYLCDRGHHLCKFCKSKIKECPLCKSNWSDARNYALEQMVWASKHVCPYKSEGCKIQETGDLMEAHIDNCEYRPFICPRGLEDNCQNISLKLSEASEHLRTIHEAELCSNPTESCTIPTNYFNEGGLPALMTWAWPVSQIEVEGVHFVLIIFARIETIFWTVLCIGTEHEARKYHAKITFKSTNFQRGQDTKIQWTIPIRSIRNGSQQLENSVNHKFISSCSFTDFKYIAKMDQDNMKYEFDTKCKIKKISS